MSEKEKSGGGVLLAVVVGLGAVIYFVSKKAQAEAASTTAAEAQASGLSSAWEGAAGPGVGAAVEGLGQVAVGAATNPLGFVKTWLGTALKAIPSAINDIFSPNVSKVYDPRTGQWISKPISRSMLKAPSSSGGT